MKLSIRRRKLASEAVEPASAGPAAPALQVLIYSNTGISEQEFSVQTEKLRQVASYDGDTRSWYAWLDIDRPERAAEMLTVLFEAARVHGTAIQVRARPAGHDRPRIKRHGGDPGQGAGGG
jgi:hypothetical protein